VIAKETARMLGLGTNIPDATGLPTMDADGKIPKDLGKKYGKMILEADGFAQVGCNIVIILGIIGPLRLAEVS
jgi:H+-transporting ATPase